MGLDSVELVMEIENYFGIRIPDSEVEKIYTIQIMVDTVATHLNIAYNGKELRDDIFEKIKVTFLKLGLTNTNIDLTENISKYIAEYDKEFWKSLKIELQLDVPKPDMIKKGSTKLFGKIKSLVSWTPIYDWSAITIDSFITAICANNYEKLINKKNIKSKYEIYVAVMRITVDKIGVSYYEIAPEKSFTSDL